MDANLIMNTSCKAKPLGIKGDKMSKLDRQVQQEINTWDVTRCKRCGEEISMLSADSLKDGSGWVHHDGWCHNTTNSTLHHIERETVYKSD